MNVLRSQLLNVTGAYETFGYITKEIRQYWSLPKEHYFDAVAIASQGSPLDFKTSLVVLKKNALRMATTNWQKASGVNSALKQAKFVDFVNSTKFFTMEMNISSKVECPLDMQFSWALTAQKLT